MKFWREAASLIVAARPGQLRLGASAASSSWKLPTSKQNEGSSPVNGNSTEDYKVLMLKRNSTSSFMPSRIVFPGGTLQKVDHSTAWLDLFKKVSKKSMDDMMQELQRNNSSRSPIMTESRSWDVIPDVAFRICAIRETFEESGILLAVSKSQVENLAASALPDLESGCNQLEDSSICSVDQGIIDVWRKKVQDSSTEFIRMCHEMEVVPNVWSLHEWSNWLTPVFEKVESASNKPNRFDTMFYLTCFDTDELPLTSSDNKETTATEWRKPSEYLKLQSDDADNRPKMAPPQVYELGRMKNLSSLDELNAAAAKYSSIQGLERLMPVMKMCSDAFVMLLPGDYLYPNDPDYEGTRTETDDTVLSTFAKLTADDKDKNLHRIVFKDKKSLHGTVVRQIKSCS